MPSVVVPAHNEERVISRLLAGLTEPASEKPDARADAPDAHAGITDAELEIIVVPNGCTDTTGEVAARYPGVRVVETPVASKSEALRLGDEAATGFPRLYVDADVVLGRADVTRLCQALSAPGVHAAGPERVLPMDGVAWPVRWYYDVWRRLPAVREELFGRGVIAVDQAGHARLTTFFTDAEQVMADDLAMALAFGPSERVVVPSSRVEIRPPRTLTDLIRRRVRAMTGNARLDGQARPAPRTGSAELRGVVAGERGGLRRLRMMPKVAVFLAVAVIARLRARRAAEKKDTRWLRDESSRTS